MWVEVTWGVSCFWNSPGERPPVPQEEVRAAVVDRWSGLREVTPPPVLEVVEASSPLQKQQMKRPLFWGLPRAWVSWGEGQVHDQPLIPFPSAKGISILCYWGQSSFPATHSRDERWAGPGVLGGSRFWKESSPFLSLSFSRTDSSWLLPLMNSSEKWK